MGSNCRALCNPVTCIPLICRLLVGGAILGGARRCVGTGGLGVLAASDVVLQPMCTSSTVNSGTIYVGSERVEAIKCPVF